MNTLKQLGMKKEWIYEMILSSFSNDIPHAAPFGVKTSDFKYVRLALYKGSHTLENILDHREFVINVVQDMDIVYDALYAKDKLKYGLALKINAPVLNDAPANIEVKLTSTASKNQLVAVEAEVVHVQSNKPCIPINRAKNLLLESLIIATRVSYMPEGRAVKLLKENHRVIKKVAPDSKYAAMMEELLIKFGFGPNRC
ncbi:DUF447 family protein [Desulfococcaceae bacterium HSG9]|nr:DUF447 family protein [Desulfococcaceae bacterium HSG9]